ncbi:MAG: aminotransferase class III-fold pyridoxal phosphate-dependent enzyme [Desulfurococcales archaeon]|nr:aminotransferase class III-fold pyridoxal phosphate-dependent enzyme [Desulfurococcales archaeon]
MVYIGRLSIRESFNLYKKHLQRGKASFYEAIGFDIVMGKREGVWIWSLDGRRFFDAHCNGGVYNLGHRNPLLIKTLIAALEELDIGNHHLISEHRAILAEKLARLFPGELNRVMYSVGGGEAVDFAIKLARGYTRKKKIIYARGGYHGTTGLAIVAGDDYYKKPFEPLAPGFIQVEHGVIDDFRKVVDEDTAAVLLETIPATLGMKTPPMEYYKEIREICDKYGCLLILDEIQTGLARTGKLWGFQHYDVVPDIVVIGKGLSGGLYPITATIYRDDLEEFIEKHPFTHISTFGGSELGTVVAERVVDIVSSKSFLEHVNIISGKIWSLLENLASDYDDIIEETRGKGLFIGIKTKSKGLGPLLSLSLIHNGILAVFANNDKSVVQFLPPLITREEHLEYLEDRINSALSMVRENRSMEKIILEMIP